MDEDDLHFLDAVLFDEEEHADDDEVEEHDAAGILISRALNAGRVPGFVGAHGVAGSSMKTGPLLDGKERTKFQPLFGAENRRRLIVALTKLVHFTRKQGLLELGRQVQIKSKSVLLWASKQFSDYQRWVPTNEHTASATVSFLLFSVVMTTALGYIFVVTVGQSLALLAIAVVTLFFDLNEIASVCPEFVVRGSCQFWRFIEERLLLGKRFAGRAEWVEVSAGSASSGACKKKESLVIRWSAKFGQRFGGRRLKEKEKEALFMWMEKDRKKAAHEIGMTEESAHHLAAMNFCYTMLRGDKKGKRVKIRENFRKSMKAILKKERKKKPKKEKQGSKSQQPPTVERARRNPRNKLALELSLSKSCKHVTRRRLSWPPSGGVFDIDPDTEEVEVVMKGRSHDDDWIGEGARKDNEEFEVIESKQHGVARGLQLAGGLFNFGRKRLYSDSELILGDDDSVDGCPDRSPDDIFSALSLSFDGLDEDDSVSTTSALSAGSKKDLGDGQDAEDEKELNWLDVGAKIGIRILHSEKVQKAMANPATAEKLLAQGKEKINNAPDLLDKFIENAQSPIHAMEEMTLSPKDGAVLADGKLVFSPISPRTMGSNEGVGVSTPPRPVHAIWTSPGAAISPNSPASDSTERNSTIDSKVESDDNEDRTNEDMDSLSCGRGGDSERTKELSWCRPPSPPSPVALWGNNEIGLHQPSSPALDAPKQRARPEDNPFRKGFLQTQIGPSTRTAPSEVQRRRMISAGVKMAVPVCPVAPLARANYGRRRRIGHQSGPCHYQMATVVSSRRIYVPPTKAAKPLCLQNLNGYVFPTNSMDERKRARQVRNNCLSITVQLDKAFLRDGKFAEMVIRVMDEWTDRHDMPRHSKYPIGSCVATSFGIGVLVGWRVEDDCHVVRSLWRRRGPGSALAYLNRDALHGVVEAAVGFRVETALGRGDVVAYVDGGPEFRRGKYFVAIKQRGRHQGEVLEFSHPGILSCNATRFVPIVEQIRESAKYQIQLLTYEAMQRDRSLAAQGLAFEEALWNSWSDGFEVLMGSFMKAAEDEGVNKWLSSIISFLETLDFHTGNTSTKENEVLPDTSSMAIDDIAEIEESPAETSDETSSETKPLDDNAPAGLWFFDDLFGGIFSPGGRVGDDASGARPDDKALPVSIPNASYANVYDFLRTVLRTVAIARASVRGRPNLHLGLGIFHEVIVLVRLIIKVQERNISPKSLQAWKRTVKDVAATFGPLKRRLYKLGGKIAEKLAAQGKIAKVRIIRFVDILMIDDIFLQSLESGSWRETITRVQIGLVRSDIVTLKTSQQYLKTAKAIYNHMAPRTKKNKDAAARNGEKLEKFAIALKWLASPQRSFLALFARDDVLELIERLMVRVYRKDTEACHMLNIYAFNFHSFRHLRILNNMSIAGKLWRPVLDAADEEFSWAVSRMPENAREFIEPISKLFSLGVARFRQMKANDLSADWLDFLRETDAVKIIQQLDLKLILNLEAFCNDLKEVMVVLPYYSSIDDDILKLMDEVDLEKILKEAAAALVDTESFAQYIREKSALAVKRFLDYLPKMSIPVEKREIGEGWVLTCRDKDGGDLRLSDVCIERECMTCNVIGSGNVFSPVELIEEGLLSSPSWLSSSFEEEGSVELSILDDIADLIRKAQQHGSWQPGIGGIQIANGKSIDPALEGLPVSEVLKSGIELWKSLEIDDEELMMIAIRDVSFQIQLQKDREEGTECVLNEHRGDSSDSKRSLLQTQISVRSLHDKQSQNRRRFNPKKDPTVLFLEMKKVTCMLSDFVFRVEQKEHSSVFDPVFEGMGSLKIQNLSIRLRVECRKERINKLETEVSVPVLYLQELDIQLEKVKVKFKDTGADWLLNKITRGLRANITEAVTTNVKEEIGAQIQVALEHLNKYIEVNPDLMLTILGITIDDLEENVIWV